jgi:hypothetical protein
VPNAALAARGKTPRCVRKCIPGWEYRKAPPQDRPWTSGSCAYRGRLEGLRRRMRRCNRRTAQAAAPPAVEPPVAAPAAAPAPAVVYEDDGYEHQPMQEIDYDPYVPIVHHQNGDHQNDEPIQDPGCGNQGHPPNNPHANGQPVPPRKPRGPRLLREIEDHNNRGLVEDQNFRKNRKSRKSRLLKEIQDFNQKGRKEK